MEACGFSDKYVQAKDVERRLLGHGGSSEGAFFRVTGLDPTQNSMVLVLPGTPQTRCVYCRCFSAATGEQFAVNRLSSLHEKKFPYLAQNEMQGLRTANGFSIPRVVKFVEYFSSPGGGMYLILE